MASYLATNYRVGDGSTTIWNVSFAGARPDQGDGTEAYLDPESIKAARIDTESDGTETETPIMGTLIGPTQYEITPALAEGVRVKIYRETEKQYPLVDFTDFTTISENDLDIQARQTLYSVQELGDIVTYSDARSVEARVLAGEAEATANTAAQDAADASEDSATALSSSQTALSAANSAVSTAGSANSTANAASLQASSAADEANAARAEATSATNTAGNALSTANSASASAGTAIDVANTASQRSIDALDTANSASTTAQGAAQDASSAVATANSANQTALDAADVAADVTNFRDELDDLSIRVDQLIDVDASDLMLGSNNFSELTDLAQARANLEVPSSADMTAGLTSVNNRVDTSQADITSLRAVTITGGDGLDGGGDLTASRSLSVDSTVVRTSYNLVAGAGITGGGTLQSPREFALGTPSEVSASTENGTSASSHTHSVRATSNRREQDPSYLLAAPALNNHIESGDHDTRYYTQATVDALLARAAPENCLVDGDFHAWQANTFSGSGYGGATMWRHEVSGMSITSTRNLHSASEMANIGGGESYLTLDVTDGESASDYAALSTRVEQPKAYSDQTMTVSGWVKGESFFNVAFEGAVNFGTGGSSELNSASSMQNRVAVTTQWQFFEFQIEVPDLSTYTFGSDSAFNINWWVSAGANYASRTGGTLSNSAVTVSFSKLRLDHGSLAYKPLGTNNEHATFQRVLRYFETVRYERRADKQAGTHDVYDSINYRVPKRTASPTATADTGKAVNVSDFGWNQVSYEFIAIRYKVGGGAYHFETTVTIDARLP